MKKIILNCFTVLFIGLLSNTATGQVNQTRQAHIPVQQPGPSGFVRCSTPENEADLHNLYPDRETEAQFERMIATKIAQIKADRAAGRNIQTVYNIPVVVHVIHNGDAVGVGENITDAQVLSQIAVLNQDYRRMVSTPGGANSTGLAVDCEINFCMAQTSPTGTLTNGIDRLNIAPTTNSVANTGAFGGGADWETRTAVETMKTTTQWDPTNYFNFWVIRVGGNTLQNGGISDLLGYAQFPTYTGIPGLTGGAANTDGVVCRFDAFGTSALNDGTFKLSAPYDKGRTMTHEVGHFLGLRHIWGDTSTCPATNNSTDKDYCADTPAAAAANYDCVVINTCASTPGNDMVQNYMDYTDDTCMDTFTQNQKDRMQAVMANAIRRSTLNTSTACQTPSPIIRFQDPTGSINENTNCNYTDVTFPVLLGKAATANATVTFNVTSGTATQNVDYMIVNPSVTFPVGTTTTQYLTIRLYHDGLIEGNETINIGMTLNANGGNATLNAAASSIALTIVDNDTAPLSTQQNAIFTRTFDPYVASEISATDLDGDAFNWGVGSSAAGSTAATMGFTTNFAYSRSWDNVANAALTPDNMLTFTTPITLPAGVNTLTYSVGTTQGGTQYYFEKYSVYLTASNDATTISNATPVFTETLSAGATKFLKTVNVSAYSGQTVYLSFRHYDCVDMNWIMLDDVVISNTINASIQTTENATTSHQVLVPGSGVTYAKDATTSKIILSLTNNNNVNYGCTNMYVSRDQVLAGAAAVNYGTNTANAQKVMAKVYTVTTATNQPTGNASYTFYFTEAEIAAWETATGNSRSTLKVIKQGATATAATTLGAFGTAGPTLTATFTDGANGVYYFGTDATLSSSSFETASDIFVYPNPTKANINITIPAHYGLPDSILVTNYLGQTIFNKVVKSELDLVLNTTGYSNGIYLITVVKGNEKKTMRFVKE